MLNSDYRDILRALSERKAKFLLVGAYAMAAHGYPRSTEDLQTEGLVFQIGIAPRRIDILTSLAMQG